MSRYLRNLIRSNIRLSSPRVDSNRLTTNSPSPSLPPVPAYSSLVQLVGLSIR